MFRIGLPCCFFHKDFTRAVFKGKTLYYLEESTAQWIMREGALPVLIIPSHGKISLEKFVSEIDGLLLQGGSDVAPPSYGQTPLKPEWSGDAIRDQLEIELIQLCLKENKPVLGLCRGAQVLNVAFGGTLFQDIPTQKPKALCHRDWNVYDQLFHQVVIEPGGRLDQIFSPKDREVKVNSVHHQAIDRLGDLLKIEARSKEDGIVEAFSSIRHPFVVGVQWHPEFQDPNDPSLLDARPLLKEFFNEIQKRKGS